MIRRINVLIISILIVMGCVCCAKNEDSPLAGTSWECVEEPEILVFKDNHTGITYIKGATDGVYNPIYSSYDFIYEIKGQNITLKIFYSNFDSIYNFVIEDEETLTCGRFHYKKIHHK